MSGLVPFAVLVSTVRALRGATVVGDNVREAPLDPVDTLMSQKGEDRPLIAVYVGNEEGRHEARNLLESRNRLELAFQIFLPESVSVDVGGQTRQLDTRGLAIEPVFATIVRQITRALQAGGTPWSDVWPCFVQGIHETTSEPYLFEVPGKTRGAAREVIFVIETCDEPEYGAPMYDHWAALVALLRAEKDYGPVIADMIAAEIEAPPGEPGWRIVQTSLGLPADTAAALRLDPDAPPEPPPLPDVEEMPPFVSVTLEEVDAAGEVLIERTDSLADPVTFLPPPEPPSP